VSPSASLEALASSVAGAPTLTVRLVPALATGARLRVLITTVSGALAAVPSLTIS